MPRWLADTQLSSLSRTCSQPESRRRDDIQSQHSSWRRAARLTRDRHRHLDNPKFFRQSQQHASTAYCLTHVSTRTIGSPASQCQVLGYSRCCKCSFIKCTRGKASRQSFRSKPQVTQPVEHASRVPFVTATELFHLVQYTQHIECSLHHAG